ncbi:hypothetical protein PBI_ASERPROCKY_80 [Gordonia phage ASerpRocky]|uniref:Uncharacterized protein n=1 Tax=Gordonia phage ASerpRocky TaxID=2599841 RepID=A0A5J6TCD0_9CAUD|nr:hypothetical protein PBI_ASERPROCKY_80 [Gordonia phage ASerpRocky]
MSIEIVAAEVFDPAASGEWELPARLELRLEGMTEDPTWSQVEANYTRSHYKWLSRIFSDHIAWDENNTNLCAAIYNTDPDNKYEQPVVPVTVLFQDEMFGMDFYVAVDRVARILRKLNNGYELIPNPLFAAEKMHGWMIQHSARVCVQCVRTAAEITPIGSAINLAGLPMANKMYRLGEYRPGPLCDKHFAELQADGRSPAFVV